MTEDEAKTKWCPRCTRQIDGSVIAIDFENPMGSISCVGSACMAWRWKNSGSEFGGNQDGYCGLAGKP